MTIFFLTCTTYLLCLLSTVNSDDKLINNDPQICTDLCADCDGIGSYLNDRCECYVVDKNSETAECIDEIKKKAEEQNLTLVNVERKLLDRSTRGCSTSSGRLRLSDIIRIAESFNCDDLQSNPNSNEDYESKLMESLNCQSHYSDNALNLDVWLPNGSPDYSKILPNPQPYPYNWNEHKFINYEQIQSPDDCHLSLYTPPAPYYDNMQQAISPFHSLPQVPFFNRKVHPSRHHQLYRPSESSINPIFSSSNPQYSYLPPPHYSLKPPRNEISRNPIGSPNFYHPMSLFNNGMKRYPSYGSEIFTWPRSIDQPSPALSNRLRPINPKILSPYNYEQRFGTPIDPYSDYRAGKINPMEPLFPAANTNINMGQVDHNEGRMLNNGYQRVTTEKDDNNQLPMASMRSENVARPEKTTSSSQTPNMSQSSDNNMLINIPNTIKRTIPASLFYRHMNKREVEEKLQ